MRTTITSESVTEGHPDKVCDQISDAILDAYLAQDPASRVAVETLATTGLVLIAGEVRSDARVDAQAIARSTLEKIGYTNASYGMDCASAAVLTAIHEQSSDIAQGVDETSAEGKDGAQQGAGDQGMMYGYATDETDSYMPLPITLAHALTRRLALVRKDKTLAYLGPDGKSQVSVEYEAGAPQRVATVVVSTQHQEHISTQQVRADVLEHVIRPVCGEWIDDATTFFINPTGRFVIGGPHGDTGLTGRKIIVDTYGGIGRHGGGAFSGKDGSKVDRSGAYAARYVAKNVVAAGLAKRCEVQISYAIGVAKPVSVHIDTFGTNTLPEEEIAARVQREFDLRPKTLVATFTLTKPLFQQFAAYGHFGRDEAPWERTDKAAALRKH